MRIFGAPIDDVDLTMLERLRDDRMAESLTHDYKRQLPALGHDKEKGKLLAQLTSFANTAGGVLVVGFDGQKWELPGLADLDEDDDVRRVDELARLVEPPLPRLTHRVIKRQSEPPLLLIGVRPSLGRPHRVPLLYGGGFFARNNRGKYPMELPELRRAFLEADAWEREADGFRVDRVKRGMEGGAAFGFHNPDGFFLHIVPLGRLRELHDLSPITSSIASFANSWNVPGTRQSRPNIDGWAATITADGPHNIWVQVFRSGAVEVCFRRAMVESGRPGGANRLLGFELDGHVSRIGLYALGWLEALEIGPPYAAFISVIGAAGWQLANDSHPAARFGLFDRQLVMAPAVVLEETPESSIDALKPVLDLVWQAGGWPDGTPNVDAEGRLKVPRPSTPFSLRSDTGDTR